MPKHKYLLINAFTPTDYKNSLLLSINLLKAYKKYEQNVKAFSKKEPRVFS